MLEKITTESGNLNMKVFRDITRDEHGTMVCYVRDGTVKMSRVNKPFVTLYLQDVEGSVLPGYIFDVDSFKNSGLELSKVTNNLVRINYQENYLVKYGLTLILDKVEYLKDPSIELLTKFVGSADDLGALYSRLLTELGKKVGIKIALPYSICNIRHMDYYCGKTGGVLRHYWDMFQTLSVFEGQFTARECRELYSTFLLYIFAHNNYIVAESKEEADITLVTKLTAALAKYASTLKMGAGATEIVHIFFGYEPKDIYVRLVRHVSDYLLRSFAEINLWKTLPISREGNAGYGVVKRYLEEGKS